MAAKKRKIAMAAYAGPSPIAMAYLKLERERVGGFRFKKAQ
jgi:hypothetical protein